MFLLNLDTHDPFFNLALEEVLLKQRTEEYLILGINEPSVIIGKHQSAHREVNTQFVTENNIPVIRRITGGGTVFHDDGNLNFTFISQSEEGKQVDFKKYTRPVIDFLISLGIAARLEGKSDIKAEGFKISGNAEHVYRNRVLHHGTLLFSSSMYRLKGSIRSDKSCYKTRAVDSNPSSVMNLNEKLKGFTDINAFCEEMINYFILNISGLDLSVITLQDAEDALALAEGRYRTWEWNYAYGPEYIFNNEFLFEDMIHSCSINVNGGLVSECRITGSSKMLAVADKLKGRRHMVSDFLKVFEKENQNISREVVYNFF